MREPDGDGPRRDEDPAEEQALAGARRTSHADDAFPGEHIRDVHGDAACATSGWSAIDVQQFHVWHDNWLEQGDWLETIEALKQEGKIGALRRLDQRPRTRRRRCELVRSGRVDTVQVIYNVFDQSPEDELFPAIAEHDVGVLARVPFDEGGLTGSITPDTEFPDGDFRATYFQGDRKQQVAERVAGDRRRPRHRAGADRRDRAALHPLARRRSRP